MNISSAGGSAGFLPDLAAGAVTPRRSDQPSTATIPAEAPAAEVSASQPSGAAPASAGGYQLIGARIVSMAEPPPRQIDVLA